MWIKVWRDSSAMAGRPHYAEYEDEDDTNSILEYYDEKIHGDGCHNLKWEKIEKPPKEWIVKQIKRYTEMYKNLYKNIEKTRLI